MENEEEKKEDVLADFSATTTYELVKALYKNDMGFPFEMTEGQNDIFDCIFKKQSPDGKNRIWVATVTQYGKSDVVSMATLTRASVFGEKWAIIAPSQSKARIIIGYLIKHIFDNEFTVSRFKIGEGESIDAIRRERSKNRITFDCGDNRLGEIFILSAESRLKNSQDVGNALMGFGSPNVIMDEAALISDESDAKTMRMVGGFTAFGTDFVVKIGNPFQRNHFLAAFEDPSYYKINIDWERAVKEGRLTEKFINEMRKKPYFRVMYENKFPEADDIDAKGWTQLISEDDIERAKIQQGEEIKRAGEKRIGQDVARGGNDQTAWCLRSMNYAEILARSDQENLTDIAAQTLFFTKEHKVRFEDVFIDDIGVGGGAVDPLHYQQKNVKGINVSMTAMEGNKFVNVRAEAYWRLREWLKKGGRLSNDDCWWELCKIKYKPDSKGRLRIMSKDEMRSRGIDSPNSADALMLTFARKEHGDTEERRRQRAKKKKKRTAGRGLKCSMGGY